MFTESIYEFLLIAGLILILIDFFIPTDIPSLIAHGLFAYAATRAIDAPVMYSVLLFIVIWATLVVLHYMAFKHLMVRFCNRFVSKTIIEEEPLKRLVGTQSRVSTVDGKLMLRVEGDLMPFKSDHALHDGDTVTVTDVTGGVVVVEKI